MPSKSRTTTHPAFALLAEPFHESCRMQVTSVSDSKLHQNLVQSLSFPIVPQNRAMPSSIHFGLKDLKGAALSFLRTSLRLQNQSINDCRNELSPSQRQRTLLSFPRHGIPDSAAMRAQANIILSKHDETGGASFQPNKRTNTLKSVKPLENVA